MFSELFYHKCALIYSLSILLFNRQMRKPVTAPLFYTTWFLRELMILEHQVIPSTSKSTLGKFHNICHFIDNLQNIQIRNLYSSCHNLLKLLLETVRKLTLVFAPLTEQILIQRILCTLCIGIEF